MTVSENMIHENDEEPHFVITADLRREFPDTPEFESNHEINDAVVAYLRQAEVGRELLARLEFDSEYSQFFAYAAQREDAEALVNIIAAMVRTLRDFPSNRVLRLEQLARNVAFASASTMVGALSDLQDFFKDGS